MTTTPTTEPVRPWKDLRATGLLWLINAALLHPRGYAIALVLDGQGEAVGWQLLGDGSEPWQFGDNIDWPFRQVEALLAAHRTAAAPATPEREAEARATRDTQEEPS